MFLFYLLILIIPYVILAFRHSVISKFEFYVKLCYNKRRSKKNSEVNKMEKETYYENYCVRLSQRGKTYKVEELWSCRTVYVEERLTSAIAEEAREDPSLVAIVLALIKVRRIDGTINAPKRRPKGSLPDKPTDEALLSSMGDILSKYSATEVIDVFADIKWHVLKEIINSEEALNEYEQYLS